MPLQAKRTLQSSPDIAAQEDGDNRWKAKYYDSLDALESKEAAWGELEANLFRHVGQIALALYGAGDQALDQHLDQVRRITRQADEQALSGAIDSLHRYLETRETPNAVGAGGDAASDYGPLRQFLKGLGETVPEMARFERAFEAEPSPEKAQALADAAAQVLRARMAQTSDPKDADGESGDSDNRELDPKDVLKELVRRLDVPDEMVAQLDAVRESLAKPLTKASFTAVVSSIANLVSELRRKLQSQRLEIERFLLGVHRRLGEIGATLDESEADRRTGEARTQSLKADFEDEVTAMRHDMVHATDLQGLKDVVGQRLDNITIHLERHVRDEAVANASLKARINKLKGTVLSAEAECQTLRKSLEAEKAAAQLDALTGLYNRAAFDAKLVEEHARSQRGGGPFSLLVWDIDHFKNINDTFGHQAGDKVLKAVAQLIQSRVRKTDYVARYGGEEMVVVMPNTRVEAAQSVAEQLRGALERSRFRYGKQSVSVTASCGLSESRGEGEAEDVFKRADDALYKAKASGRNRCVTG